MAALIARYTRLCTGVLRREGCNLTGFSRCSDSVFSGCSTIQSLKMNTLFKRQFSLDELSQDEMMDEDRLFSLVTLVVKGSDEAVLDSYTQFVTRAAKILNLDISRRTILETHFEKRTLLKSPHIYKKHQAQYEVRTHGRMVQLQKLTGDTADIFLEYIQRNLPEGVSMNVEQTEVLDVPEYIRPPVQIIHERIEKSK
ncbi:small ribosomal subunit protein uS10m-like [Rhopilema esculentum]|uniref:small ribosomal subunit protein uS10m-like n=1 Tax=Rhopilema esculentum TaxID=499914 RepID=UPI0031D1E5FC|eukprot:gene2918-1159_t